MCAGREGDGKPAVRWKVVGKHIRVLGLATEPPARPVVRGLTTRDKAETAAVRAVEQGWFELEIVSEVVPEA